MQLSYWRYQTTRIIDVVCFTATDPAQNFKDSAEFYRFTADDGHEGPKEKDRKQTLQTPAKKNFNMVNDTPCKTFTVSECVWCQAGFNFLGSFRPHWWFPFGHFLEFICMWSTPLRSKVVCGMLACVCVCVCVCVRERERERLTTVMLPTYHMCMSIAFVLRSRTHLWGGAWQPVSCYHHSSLSRSTGIYTARCTVARQHHRLSNHPDFGGIILIWMVSSRLC